HPGRQIWPLRRMPGGHSQDSVEATAVCSLLCLLCKEARKKLMNPIKQRSYGNLIWILALVGVTLDLVSKYWVFGALYNDGAGGKTQIIPGAFQLLAEYTDERDRGDSWLSPLRTLSGDMKPRVNNGALFGLGGEEGDGQGGNTAFAVISIIAAAAIIFWGTRAATVRDLALCMALGLILGGTLGNLYDRLIFSGVRDFLDF